MPGSTFHLETEPHQAAKVAYPVKLGLTDGRVLDAEIFLLSDAKRPGGVTSIEAVLDGPREFIPVLIQSGHVLLSRSSIRTVGFAASAPGMGEMSEAGGTLDVVTLKLDSGEVVSGVLRYMAPAESMRMSDVFNRPGRFLTLSEGDRLILVSKAHVVQASF